MTRRELGELLERSVELGVIGAAAEAVREARGRRVEGTCRSGRLDRTTLMAGSYRVLLAAVDGAGNRSKTARAHFEVLVDAAGSTDRNS